LGNPCSFSSLQKFMMQFVFHLITYDFFIRICLHPYTVYYYNQIRPTKMFVHHNILIAATFSCYL
ncbi:hypothetical protein L9F63_009025, partial [Diploptera punctata]